MNLLSSFLSSQLIPALESVFLSHEPEEQAAILEKVKLLVDHLGIWLGEKLDPPPKAE